MLQLYTRAVLLYLLFVLALFNGSLSNVHSRQEARGENVASNGKAMWNDDNFQTSPKKFGLGGREMGSLGSFMKGHGPCERPSKVERRKQSIRNLLSREKELAGFVAFNADYKGPRHHPPKNN